MYSQPCKVAPVLAHGFQLGGVASSSGAFTSVFLFSPDFSSFPSIVFCLLYMFMFLFETSCLRAPKTIVECQVQGFWWTWCKQNYGLSLFLVFSFSLFSFIFCSISLFSFSWTTTRAARPSRRIGWKRLKHSTRETLQKITVLQACHSGEGDGRDSSMPGGWTRTR